MTPETGPNPNAPICCIVVREMLIAQDLTAMIAEARPDLHVAWATTPEQALADLAKAEPVVLAFVDQPPRLFAEMPLATRLHADNAVLVYLGHDVQDVGPGDRTRALPYPFGPDEVSALFTTLQKE